MALGVIVIVLFLFALCVVIVHNDSCGYITLFHSVQFPGEYTCVLVHICWEREVTMCASCVTHIHRQEWSCEE